MANIKRRVSKQLSGVIGNLQNGNQVVIFQKDGKVKAYDNAVHIKRPNQYKGR